MKSPVTDCPDPSAQHDLDLLARVLSPAPPRGRRAAVAVLDAAGGLAGLPRLGAPRLARCPGVGPAGAKRLMAAIELGRRVAMHGLSEARVRVEGFDDVVAWARPRLVHLEHEEVWLLGLDGQNGLTSARCIARGGQHGCALTPRDILRPALRDAASGIVLVHNHPSGSAQPSPEDFAMTRAVAAAARVVGLVLLDHVVVAREGQTSLAEAGAIDP